MEGDLSTTHHPIDNNIATQPASTEEWAKFKLNKEQIELFNSHGYVTDIPVLTEEQLDYFIKELAPLMSEKHPKFGLWYEFHSNESGDPNQVLFHSLGAWRISVPYHDILWHPAILAPASQLLAASINSPEEQLPVRFWHDQLFCKPAEHGGPVAWHQDYSYWTRSTPMCHLTIHIALDDQTLDNGCLHYIPGSHKWELLPITSRHFNNMDSIKEVLTPEQLVQFENRKPMLLKKGHACIHHALMVHGSYGNNSKVPRRAVVVNVFQDGTKSDSDEALLTGVPAVPKGQKIEGQFFPLLYRP